MNIRELREGTDFLLQHFHYLLLVTPILFALLRSIRPGFLMRNVLTSVSAPGALAAIWIFAVFIAFQVAAYNALEVRHGGLARMIMPLERFPIRLTIS